MFEQFVYSLETQLMKLGQRLWSPDARSRQFEEADDLIGRLQKRQELLSRSQCELDAARRRITSNRTSEALLVSQIESCVHRGVPQQAYPHALELDRVRQALAEDQTALPRIEQRCWSLQFQVRQLERQLARVQEAIYCGRTQG